MKKRNGKRILSGILVIALVFTMLLPDNLRIHALAAENGTNLLKNADFQDESDSLVEKADNNGWDVYAANWGGGPGAAVTPTVISPSGISLDIGNIGYLDWHVQLYQGGIHLEKGENYKITFDIISDKARTIDIKLQNFVNDGYAPNLGQLRIDLEGNKKVSGEFTTDSPIVETITTGKLVFLLGKIADTDAASNIMIDNVRLTEVVEDVEIPPEDSLQPPVLSEDISDNVFGNPIELTFTDNEDWRSKINNITVDGVAIGPTGIENVTVLPGKIILDQNLFSADSSLSEKIFTIEIEADGYKPAVAKQTITRSASDWNLAWNDEFSGTTLDETKWSYQLGVKANPDGPIYWGNNEKQYYTKENLSVQDGKLVIEAKNDGREGMPYTSSRIRTVTDDKTKLFTTKYGKVEAKMKLPKGQGFWPAFWMLPADETYGTWAASGELDIMEARGHEPGSVDGTIHYGSQWPNNTYSGGRYIFDEGTDIGDFHIYSIEWEPGEIRWYVDGELYSTKNRWSSRGAGEAENYTYPAPYDVDFYLLFNLAVGGNYVSNLEPTPEDFKTPVKMEVDYVRVYQKDSYNEDVTEPEAEKDTAKFESYMKDSDGSFVTDRNFDTVNMTAMKDGKLEDTSNGQTGEARFPLGRWFFATQSDFGASATLTKEVIGGNTFAKVAISNGGNQTYSTQLIQYVSLAKGYTYEIAFDAKADSPRTVIVKAAGNADAGFPTYSPSFEVPLTNELQHYSYKFTMSESSQDKARLELNMGIDTNGVTIGNVTVKQTEPDVLDEDAKKAPLENGNHIYNGTFDQGTKRMKFWHVDEAAANTSNRQMEIIPASEMVEEAKLYQKGIQLLQKDTYQLSFDGSAGRTGNITVKALSKDGGTIYGEKEYSLSTDNFSFSGEEAFIFTMPEGITDEEAQIVFCLGMDQRNVIIDNVKLIRTTNQNVDYTSVNLYPILNGDFSVGIIGWSGHQTNLSGENGILKAPGGLGVNVYDNMVMAENMLLSGGMTYILSFKAKASESKKIKFTIEDASYAPILEETDYSVDNEWITYSKEFKVNATKKYSLKFQIGAIGAFDFYLDDVVLQVKDAPLKKPALIVSGLKNVKVGKAVVLNYYGSSEWESGSKEIYVNGNKISDEFVEYGSGKITLAPSIFTKSAVYEIYVKADGFAETNRIAQTIIPMDGNLLINGDFSEGLEPWQGWFKYNGDAGRNVGSVSVENNMAKVFHEWNEGQNWDLQFYQENIALEGGKTYILSFDSKATVERPIDIEIAVGVPLGKVSLGTDMEEYELTYTPGTDMMAKINFLLGNVTNGDLTTPGSNTESHSIYFDNIKLIEQNSTDPTTPTNPSNSGNSTPPDNIRVISSGKVDFKVDNKAREINANILTGLKTISENNLLDITASIPVNELLNGFTSDYPMNLNISMNTDLILTEIRREDVKKINISIVLPGEIYKNKNFILSRLALDKRLLTEATALGKDISIIIKNEKGEVQYSWDFTPEIIHKDKSSSINLLLESLLLRDDKDVLKLLNSAKEKDVSEGIVIDVKNKGTLPWASTITIPVMKQLDLQQKKEVYLYHYNEKTKKLEELPTGILQIAKDGTAELPVIQGGKYVILTKKANSNIVTTLLAQVKVSAVKKTLPVKKSANIQVTLPATITSVKKFTKKNSLATIEGKITYKSGNSSIVGVASNGKLTAKKSGKTIIYVTVQLKNGIKKTYKSTITVK